MYSKTKKKVRHTICESLDVSQALQIRNTAVKELSDNPTVMAERSETNFSQVSCGVTVVTVASEIKLLCLARYLSFWGNIYVTYR